MKKYFKLLLATTIIFICFKPSDTYKLTEGQAVMTYNFFQAADDVLLNSDLPSKQVQQLLKISDSIKKVIAIQFTQFNNDTTKRK